MNEWAVYMQDSEGPNLVKEIWQPLKPNTTKTTLQICATNTKSNKKMKQLRRKLLSNIEGIYTQFSNLCIHEKLQIANHPVFRIVYPDDLKLG